MKPFTLPAAEPKPEVEVVLRLPADTPMETLRSLASAAGGRLQVIAMSPPDFRVVRDPREGL